MLKMFSTQLSGLFKRIQDKEEFAFEDAARLIAQAAISEGVIYIYGTDEMEAVELEATVGAEPLRYAKPFPAETTEMSESDRAIIVSRYSTDPRAIDCAKKLQEMGILFVAISTKADGDGEDLFDLADASINLQLTKGLLPDETGNRFGLPTGIAALFAYYGLKFTFDEILAEYEEELE
jgi:uncharacterized phosphosugar-binding protein